MTREFNQQVLCPHCKRRHTAETGFNRWMRSHPKLASQEGIMRFDCDVLLHRYKHRVNNKGESRKIQFLMFIEVKTFGARLRREQQDTLSLFSQALRNRRDNRHKVKRGRHLRNHSPLSKGFSLLLNQLVLLRMFGAHLLTFSHNDPADSEWMTWNEKPIDQDHLLGLLRFEIDPDTLLPMDLRVHQSLTDPPPTLFG